MEKFSYEKAFERNIGLLTLTEQEKLKSFTIAIPGMGGVGGSHLISLIRHGFEKFKIADNDIFELENFNRQYGATMDTIGKGKVEVMVKKALEINPNCHIEVFKNGVDSHNLEKFLDKCDLVIDSLDFFEVETRRKLFNTAHKMNIPVITAGPIGFSTAYLIFLPKGPNFDEYFCVNEKSSYNEKLASFAIGLAPKLLQRKYMKNIDLKEKKGPSSIAAVNLCSGIATISAIKILLKKGTIKPVPYYHQFDSFRNKYICKKLLFRRYNPFHILKIKMVIKMIERGQYE